ncbi:hypothetical protein [Streptomyces coriariae]|uniref:hypothetical protein n=1 Tax=Streptomyces coriariae TaxID=2864460 RepID=UPI002342CB22|nr:hypothetical protein [Streptomyces coriariae]
MSIELVADAPWRFRIEQTGAMRVPGCPGTRELLPDEPGDQALQQVADVATLERELVPRASEEGAVTCCIEWSKTS